MIHEKDRLLHLWIPTFLNKALGMCRGNVRNNRQVADFIYVFIGAIVIFFPVYLVLVLMESMSMTAGR